MNKKTIIYVLVILLFCVTHTTGLKAGNLSGQVDFFTRYIWRGFDLNPVNEPVLQPSLTYAFGDSGFAVNVWFSFNFLEKNKEMNEMDITLSYDFKLTEAVSLSAGLIHYGFYWSDDFKFKDHTTHELYLSASLPKVPFNPSAAVYINFEDEAGKGVYANFSLSHTLKLETISLDLSAALGYNSGQFLLNDSGISDLTIGAAVPFKLGKFTLTAMANYAVVFLDEIGDNQIWFGASLAL